MSPFVNARVLTGPTGSGKSAIALELAESLNAEIIALDSMTLYRGMDIGTAKPTLAERAKVPHHLIDVLDPHESANVAWWLEQSVVICQDIVARGKVPLFVGGTPLYLKALLHGLFESPQVDPAIRAALEAEAAAIGPVAFHAKLAGVDSKSAARLHPNDVRRVVRALEVYQGTGTPISELQRSWESATFENESPALRRVRTVILEWPREVLYQRIDARVDAMLAAGWVEECRTLLDRPLSREACQAVGYAELFEFLRNGEQNLQSHAERIKMRTRQFAKRQLTWYRKIPGTMIAAGEADAANRVRQALQQA